MTLEGVDALNPPSGAALEAAGKRFICCYTRALTKAQIADFRAHGVDLVLIFESSGVDFTGGAPQGEMDAQTAEAQRKALGLPAAPIYFAIDTGNYNLQDVNAYLQGCASVIGKPRVGVYGSYGVVEAAYAGSWCEYRWQTYAWSNGAVSQAAHIFQYLNGQSLGGATVDLDRTVLSDVDFGQVKWGAAPWEDEMLFWAKDPSSAACVLTNGMWAVGLPDDATLVAYQKAGVPEVVLSQAAWNALIPATSLVPGAGGGLSAAQAQQLSDTAAAAARIEAALKDA